MSAGCPRHRLGCLGCRAARNQFTPTVLLISALPKRLKERLVHPTNFGSQPVRLPSPRGRPAVVAAPAAMKRTGNHPVNRHCMSLRGHSRRHRNSRRCFRQGRCPRLHRPGCIRDGLPFQFRWPVRTDESASRWLSCHPRRCLGAIHQPEHRLQHSPSADQHLWE
jgi:hypothetical protein